MTSDGDDVWQEVRVKDPTARRERIELQTNRLKIVIHHVHLEDIGAVHRELEAAHGPLIARRYLRSVDHAAMLDLARRGVRVAGDRVEVVDPRNDPRHIDEHLVLLWGMKNERVRRTQAFLRGQGLDCPEHGVLDDATLAAHDAYLREYLTERAPRWRPRPAEQVAPSDALGDVPSLPYVVREGETLREVAEAHGIWDWWDLVDHLAGVDPARAGARRFTTRPGEVVGVPDWRPVRALGNAHLRRRGLDAARYFGGQGYLSLWGVLAARLVDARSRACFPAGTRFRLHDLDGPVEHRDLTRGVYAAEGVLDADGAFAVDLPRADHDLWVRPPGEEWRPVRSFDVEALRARRAACPADPGWTDAHVELAAARGLDVAFVGPEAGLDPWSVTGVLAGGPAREVAAPPVVEVLEARWSSPRARPGEPVTLRARVRGAPEGARARLSIVPDGRDSLEAAVARLEAVVRAGAVEAEWTPRDEADPAGPAAPPTLAPAYWFACEVEGAAGCSGPLALVDAVELEVVDHAGRARAGLGFVVHAAGGEVRRGRLDAAGRARVDDLPVGPLELELVP